MKRDTTTDKQAAIVWFRNDLRISDNAALMAASGHSAVVPVFIRETGTPARELGAARTWWLHHSLSRLAEKLETLGAPLLLLSGDPASIIPELVKATGASAVYWNRRYDPAHQSADAALKAELQAGGLIAESFAGQLLQRADAAQDRRRHLLQGLQPVLAGDGARHREAPAPARARQACSAVLRIKGLNPRTSQAGTCCPSARTGRVAFVTHGPRAKTAPRHDFRISSRTACQGYADRRDVPGVDATSGLSPHLASGEITPAQIIDALGTADTDASAADRSKFRKEVGWREFSWHLLANEPGLPDRKSTIPNSTSFRGSATRKRFMPGRRA